jgi:hypothetical protein
MKPMASNLKLVESEQDPDETALRHTLRRELEQRDAALSLRDKAKSNVEAASDALQACAGELERYAQLDEQIAEERANQIAASLESGGGFPRLETPVALQALTSKRDEVGNRRLAIAQALKRLEATLAEAERTLAARQSNVASAALSVVGHIVDMQARELRYIEEQAAALRKKLIGSCALRPGAQTPLHPSTLALLRDDPANAILSRNDGSEARVWNGLFAKLLNDPEARLDE